MRWTFVLGEVLTMRTLILIAVLLTGCNELVDCPEGEDGAVIHPLEAMVDSATGDAAPNDAASSDATPLCPDHQFYCPDTQQCEFQGTSGTNCGPCHSACNPGVQNIVCFASVPFARCCVPVGDTCDTFNCPGDNVCESAHGNGTPPFYCCSPYGAAP